MIRHRSQQQLSLAEIDWPFQTALDATNRWVKLSECIPWDALVEGYYQGRSVSQGPTMEAHNDIRAIALGVQSLFSNRFVIAMIARLWRLATTPRHVERLLRRRMAAALAPLGPTILLDLDAVAAQRCSVQPGDGRPRFVALHVDSAEPPAGALEYERKILAHRCATAPARSNNKWIGNTRY